MIELQLGDVIRCPGYPGVKHPARFALVEVNPDMVTDNWEMGIEYAKDRFKEYGKVKHPEFGGSFWAIERNGVEIWPNPNATQTVVEHGTLDACASAESVAHADKSVTPVRAKETP